MKITSNILFDIARVIGLTVPGPADNNVDIPAQILPVTNLQTAIDEPVITDTAANQRFSCHVTTFLNVDAASGAIDTLLLTLAKGLWRFNVIGAINSNYMATSNMPHAIYLRYPVTLSPIFLAGLTPGGAAAAPIGYSISRIVEILLPVDGVQVRAQALNNIAAQNSHSTWDVIATKLL
jgi:hypothetical protein